MVGEGGGWAWYKTYIGLHSLGISIIHRHKLNCRSLIAESGCPFSVYWQASWSESAERFSSPDGRWSPSHWLSPLRAWARLSHRKHYISDLFFPPALYHHHYMPFMSLRLCLCASCTCASCCRFQHAGPRRKCREKRLSPEDKRSSEALQRKCRSY